MWWRKKAGFATRYCTTWRRKTVEDARGDEYAVDGDVEDEALEEDVRDIRGLEEESRDGREDEEAVVSCNISTAKSRSLISVSSQMLRQSCSSILEATSSTFQPLANLTTRFAAALSILAVFEREEDEAEVSSEIRSSA